MNSARGTSRKFLLPLILAGLLSACRSDEPVLPPSPDPILEPIFTPTVAVCPSEPRPLTVDVSTAAKPATISGRLFINNSNSQSFDCQIDADGQCRLLELPIVTTGSYGLEINLPNTGQMKIADGVVAYDYLPFEVVIAQGSRQQQYSEQATETITIEFSVRLDESNCLVADFRDVNYATQAAAGPETEIHLNTNIIMTDLGSDICRQEPVDTHVPSEILLPAGTELADVRVVYEVGGQSQTAACLADEHSYTCSAILPNPIIGQPLAIRAIVNGQVYTGLQLPFDNLCLYFGD